MANKDIFGNKNNEEIFDSSIDGLLDNSTEDTYGLNTDNKANNSGTEPLATEIERLSTENLNITYIENIGDDTENLVSSPLLFNQNNIQNDLLGRQVTDFNKTDIDLDKNNIDSLTGNNKNNPLVGTFEFELNSNSNLNFSSSSENNTSSSPTPASASTPPKYAIRTEKQIRINNGGDLDGDSLDISDDALIYSAQGFTINGNITLPVQRDSNGNPLRDNSGKLILVDNAVTVAPDYNTINANTNQYSNLVPPQVVDEQIIDIPAYDNLKQQTLDSVIAPGTSTVNFNSSQNPLNNSRDWDNKFPAPGTLGNPTVVRVTGGGLNIPNKVSISNYVIIVENGDINFNGSNHNFENVVLIAENGNINLSRVQATDLSVFASRSINMNGQARYSGATLLASGSNNGSINFNGTTASTDGTDTLRVVSQGRITFNAASDTRGSFESVGDFTFNNNSTLYGTIAAKGFITFNNGANVVYANDLPGTGGGEEDTTPPIINANLANDTGASSSDGITSDPTISGTVTDENQISELRAGFDGTDVNNYVDITAQLQPDGSFTLDKSTLESIKGDILADDSYTLYLQATDSEGNTSDVYEINFTLDSITPPTSNLGFAIKTESKLTINGGGDLDGEPFDLNDDALIYAAKGFRINGNIDLPVKLNPDGTPQLDDSGRKVLRDNAVSVADGYTTSTGPNNQYAGLNPPSILEEAITVDIPAYDNLLQQKLDSFIPDNSQTITFDINDSQNRINNANNWNQNFPAPGTSDNPTVVEVIGGELSIPNNVTLSNYVIIVQQGNIRFRGSNHNLDNVVFVAENGDINLAKAKSSDISVFASGSINMNGAATFAGDTLIASGGNVTFRGASKDISTSDTIKVVSQGNITFNGASDTRGVFEAAGKFTSNGQSTIYGMISAKGDIRFNGGVRVVASGIDSSSPIIDAALTNDTGESDTDLITNDPTISGTVIDDGEIVQFSAGFNELEIDNYVDVLPQRDENGNFSFDRTTLESIYGDALPDGNHTLHLISTDASGNVSNLFDLTFTLDTVTPAPDNLDLTAATDSGVDDSDNITNNSTPEITGNAEVGSKVELLNNSIKIGEATVDGNGNWQITTNNLADGDYSITAIATDIAGNQNQSDLPLSLTIDTAAPDAPINLQLSSDSDSGISDRDNITNDENPTITGLASVGATVELFSDGISVGTTTASSDGNWEITVEENLTDGIREITAVATDVAGNQSVSSAPLLITIDSSNPQITLTNPITGTDLNQSSRLVGIANGTGSDLVSFSYKFDSGEDILVNLNDNGGFDQEFDFTGIDNGSHTLILSTTDVAGNVETAVYSVSVVLDSPPVITAALINDSGESNTDKITNDPTINGTIADDGIIVQLKAGFNDVEVDNFVDVTARLQSDGSFSLDKTALETIYGDTLPDGNHILRIQAIDDYGNSSEILNLNFTLDTTPPPISNPDLPAFNDSGISNSDNITNNSTPDITGNTEAGSKVELFVDENSIGEVEVDGNGNWTSTTEELTDGEYEITATVTDIAGNTSNSDIPLQLNIDTTQPEINFDSNLENQILVEGARLTGNANGTGSDITAIEYSFDEIPASTTITLDNAGNFDQELDLTGLENGSHTLSIAITDAAGNVNTIQYNVTVAIDEQPPVITVSLTSDTGTDSTDRITNNPNISGTVADENQIVELKAGFNDVEVDNYIDITARLQSDGNFSLDKTTLEIIYGDVLPDGIHTLYLISQDEFGNQSDIYDFEFTLDTTIEEPTVLLIPESDSGTSSSDNITLDNTPTISGTGEAGSTVQLLENNQNLGETTVGNDGTWEITTPEFADGAYELTVTTTDIAGNQSFSSISTPLSINIDTVLPQFDLTNPIDNSPLTPESKIIGTVNGTGSDINAVTYRFNDSEEIPISFNSTGTFNQAFDLTGLNNGDYTVTVTTTDVAGNVNTNQYNVTVEIDINSPIIDVSLNNDTAPNNTTNTDRITSDPTINGTITDNNNIVSLEAGFNNNLVDVTSSLQTDGSFSFDKTQLETILGNTLEDGIQTLQL